jgi:hypothetical protein
MAQRCERTFWPNKRTAIVKTSSAFACLRRKRSQASLAASPAQRLLFLGHSSDSGRPKISWGRKTSANHLVKVETVWRTLEIFPLELFARPLRSSSCTLVLPSLNNWHHFFTFPSFIAIMLMWISAGRTFFAFKTRITYRRSQAAGFSIFVFIFNGYNSEWGKNYDTVLCNTSSPWYIEDSWSLQKVCASRFPEAPLTAKTTTITTTITTTPQLVMVRGDVVFVVQHSTVGTYTRTRLEIEFHVSCRNFSRHCAILCTSICMLTALLRMQFKHYCTVCASKQSKA